MDDDESVNNDLGYKNNNAGLIFVPEDNVVSEEDSFVEDETINDVSDGDMPIQNDSDDEILLLT